MNFSQISYPITSLQQKGKKFEWIEEFATNFEQLNHFLTNALVLNIAYWDKYFVVCTYACKRGIGGVLMQEKWVWCYESRKLNEHEKNYVTHDLELEAIIHALNMWMHYLLRRGFILMRDHSRWRYLFYQPNLNAIQDIWLATLSEFDFEIMYIKGKENMVAYTFSRRVRWVILQQWVLMGQTYKSGSTIEAQVIIAGWR